MTHRKPPPPSDFSYDPKSPQTTQIPTRDGGRRVVFPEGWQKTNRGETDKHPPRMVFRGRGRKVTVD